MNEKPTLTTRQIWNANIGFFGLQAAFILVMTNISRIFSALGTDTNLLSLLWLAPPVAGLMVQPLIGYWSDRVWTRYGRRIPFILAGTVISCSLLIFLPEHITNSKENSSIWDEVAILFLLQGAFNMSMTPFRTLMGDLLNVKQQNLGFSLQTLVGSTGSIIGSSLPFILAVAGLRNEPADGERLAPTLTWSFYAGAMLLMASTLWSCLKTKEYPHGRYASNSTRCNEHTPRGVSCRRNNRMFLRLGCIQFFSWLGFFFFWVYATDAIAGDIWKVSDPLSESYNEAGNWFGILSGFYCVVSIVFTYFLPGLADRYGRKRVYFASLVCSGIGFSSFYFIDNQYWSIIPMLGVGIGWASTVTFPFALMASNTSGERMGLQMGLVNITITLPQITGGLLGGLLFKHLAYSDSMTMILFGGLSLLVASLFVLGLDDRPVNGKN